MPARTEVSGCYRGQGYSNFATPHFVGQHGQYFIHHGWPEGSPRMKFDKPLSGIGSLPDSKGRPLVSDYVSNGRTSTQTGFQMCDDRAILPRYRPRPPWSIGRLQLGPLRIGRQTRLAFH